MDKNVQTFNLDSQNNQSARPTYPKAIFEFLSQQVANNETAWDCACGNGQTARSLADYFARVYASDINENQVQNRIEHQNIIYPVQNSEHIGYTNHSFDLICLAQALQFK
ncbi:MAG: methyltransferase domain-containing protein [Bacteroidales bacterium]|nr:methyltransferase domain-containing protein [Bacteroidales bacterium]